MNNREIEVRFLNIDVKALKKRLKQLGAIDFGEDLLREIIYYDKEHTWSQKGKFVRIRKTNKGTYLSYKHHESNSALGAKEIEFIVDDYEKAAAFLIEVGLDPFREQEKKRHSYTLDKVTIDFDTWPSLPTYMELEGIDVKSLQDVCSKLQLKWEDVIQENAKIVIEEYYNIPVSTLKHFTFSRID